MSILALCALAIALPTGIAFAVPRRQLIAGEAALLATVAAVALRFWLGPQVFHCSGGICLDDALLAIALSAGAGLVLLIGLGRWLWYRRKPRT